MLLIKTIPAKSPKLLDVTELRTGSVYMVVGEKFYIMKVRTSSGHNLFDLSTGIFIETPHQYKYLPVSAELVVQAGLL